MTDDGLCRHERLTCMGVPFRVFGGTPLGIYAVGPGRQVGLIVRALGRVGLLVVFYRCGTGTRPSAGAARWGRSGVCGKTEVGWRLRAVKEVRTS